MTYDVEHLFMCLSAICISSLVKCLLKCLTYFLTGLLVFLLLSFKNSLHFQIDVFFLFYKFFIVIQLQLYAFSPHPSTPPQLNPPPSPTSPLIFPCVLYSSSCNPLSSLSPPRFYWIFHLCFLQSLAWLLILLIVLLAEQKFLVFMKSNLSIISFMNYAFGVVSNKSLPNPRSFRFSPMLPLGVL